MKTTIVPLLFILCFGAFIGNSTINRITTVKTVPVVEPIAFNPISSNKLILDLNNDTLKIESTAEVHPTYELNVTRPVEYVKVYVPKYITDTVEVVVKDVRMMPFRLATPNIPVKRLPIPNRITTS